MREYAPNQLYLGSRFAPKPREAVEAAAQFCDVVSFNIYKETLADPEYSFLSTLGKPIIIGEFHFGALDRGMFSGGLVPRANQAERAKAYETYVRSALARPEIVGVHWFQYIDEPLTGRFDGENYNIGFVDVTDTPYPELRDAARRVNNSIYRLAGGK
jgi:agarase